VRVGGRVGGCLVAREQLGVVGPVGLETGWRQLGFGCLGVYVAT